MATHELVSAQIKRVEALSKELASGKLDVKSAGRPLALREERAAELEAGIASLERAKERSAARFDVEIADLKGELEALQKDSSYKAIEEGQPYSKRKSPAKKSQAKAKTKAKQPKRR